MSAIIKRFNKTNEYFFHEGCFINELSNSVDDADVSIAQARVEPGKTTKWHSLRNTTERYVIISGTGRVELGHKQTATVSPGDIVIIPADLPQRITNTGIEDLIFLAVCSPRFQRAAYRADTDTQT